MYTKKYLLERRQNLNYVERLNTYYFDDYLIYETPSKFEVRTDDTIDIDNRAAYLV